MSDLQARPFTVPHETILRLALKELREMRDYQRELAEENRALAKAGRDRVPRCKHGTYIGDSYGADYLCWACESGESDHAIALGHAHARARRIEDSIASHVRMINIFVEAMAKQPDDLDKLLAGIKWIARERREILALQKELED